MLRKMIWIALALISVPTRCPNKFWTGILAKILRFHGRRKKAYWPNFVYILKPNFLEAVIGSDLKIGRTKKLDYSLAVQISLQFDEFFLPKSKFEILF